VYISLQTSDKLKHHDAAVFVPPTKICQ